MDDSRRAIDDAVRRTAVWDIIVEFATAVAYADESDEIYRSTTNAVGSVVWDSTEDAIDRAIDVAFMS